MPTRMYVTFPSYAVTNPTERAKYLRKANTWAEIAGWEVVTSPLLTRYQATGTWAPLELRAEDMQKALEHEVVWAARGGYGAVELIPTLLDAQPSGKPMLIGYSDITVLHACWAVRGWGARVYGTLADSVEDSRQGDSMRAFVHSESYSCTNETEPAGRVLRPGTARAKVFAACLVVLANLCGTPAMPSLSGSILAIEDIDERPYAIDFALHQLFLSGALQGVAGLLGGSFHHQPPADYGGPTVDDILAKWAARLEVPAITRLPFGHMDDHMVVPCGVSADIEATPDGRWSVTWAGR